MSPSSLQFIGAATLEGLTGNPPITDMYGTGSVMDHIHLDRWADLILVAPATANYINKIAAGIGDDLLTTLFLAHDFKKPFVLAPAMNTKMYLHPTTQESLKKLKSYGVDVLETASGVLACGEEGYGKLLDPDLIVAEVEKRTWQTTESLTAQVPIEMKIKTVLITSGGTTEPIDDIRSITNTSTGATAAQIADHLLEAGIHVHFLHAKTSKVPAHVCKKTVFTSFSDLQAVLTTSLQRQKYDVVIHLAAVSDYSVVKQPGKISSDAQELQLTLKKNEKLINQIKKLNPQTLLIGFKLTSDASENSVIEKVEKLFSDAHCNYVVQNDWRDIKTDRRLFKFFEPNLSFQDLNSVQELSFKLFNTITETL